METRTKEKVPKSWSKEYRRGIYEALGEELYRELENELEDDNIEIVKVGVYEKEADDIIAHRGEVKNIATGYSNIDTLLEGFDKGELIIVSGPTATGKTMFALNCIINAYCKPQLFSTLIFTLEMTKSQITARIKNLLAETEYINDLSGFPIYFYSSKSDPNIVRMRKAMEKCKETNGLDLVMIDHLHYFSRNVENQVAEIGIVVREIKRMAVDYNIPIILISHIRKRALSQSKTADPTIDDLKDSSAIGQDADIVIMLNRDNMNEEKSNLLQVSVEKNRNKGVCGRTEMLITLPNWRLKDNG